MARQRFDEDTDRPDRRRDADGGSGLRLVLGIVAGVVVLGILVCGGLMFFGYRQAMQMERQMVEAEMMMRVEAEAARAEAARAEAARADADGPVPAGVPPQPAASKFDKPGDGGRWLVLFRSADPAVWNTGPVTAGDDFALPVNYAPPGTTHLRLRRMDTGEAVIVPITRGHVGRADPAGPARWNGGNQDEHGGRHLGLASGPPAKWQENKGLVSVLMDGFDAVGGSGFGHGHHVEDGGQKYAWKGKEIGKTAFEIAVTTGELTDEEKGLAAK